jgi:hypothetical protein
VGADVEKSNRIREQDLEDDQRTRLHTTPECGEMIITTMPAELAGLRVTCEALRKLDGS